MVFKREEVAGEVVITPVHMRSTEELKAILSNYPGNFEKELNAAKDNIPDSSQGKIKAIQDGKLPDLGMYWLRDRGVVLWYVQNGWLSTRKKGKEKRKWAVTQKYIEDRIPEKEEVLSELINRRSYAQGKNEEEFNQGL